MSGLFSSIAGLGLGAWGYDKLQGDIDQQRKDTALGMTDLQAGLDQKTQFQPWGVTSGMGTAGQDAQGNMNMALSGQQQGIQDYMFNSGQGMLDQSQQGNQAREQEIYDSLRSMQIPGEERARMGMEEQLYNQGRSGVRSNAFGGTPEQLAMAKAQAEARNTAGYQAMQQGNAEQMQQYNMGQGFMNQGYIPQQQLRSDAGMGLNAAQLYQNGQMNNANLYAQMGLGGMTADQNYANIQGNMFGNMVGAMVPAAQGIGGLLDPGADGTGGLLNWLKNDNNGNGSIWY